jgi:hypothetical protein
MGCAYGAKLFENKSITNLFQDRSLKTSSTAQRRITGLYAFRAFGPPGFHSARSASLPTPHYTQILSALEMLRISLFGRPKLRIQPERYVKYYLTILRI